MSYIPGMGHVRDYPAFEPQPPDPDYMHCETCGDEMPVVEDRHEREVSCAECGTILAAFDWDAEAERRAERGR